VAILRGVAPAEAEAIGCALVDAGIRILEVPLNSPEPFESIRILAERLGADALVGAGTVLRPEDVEKVAASGGRLVVSPSSRREVIEASVAAGLVSMPGFFTPTEAFAAIDAGAHALKLFPAEAATPDVLKAQRAVLPPEIPILVVGGVAPGDLARWHRGGADGFGIGSGIYKPGRSAEETARRALAYVETLPDRFDG
jgi:2-dehydro-3-deoxyphosphogalactonate aldolase